MVADDEVLDQRLQLGRKSRRQLLLQHLQFDDHVPEQLPAGGVGNGTRVRELVDLSDIVQERTGQQQVAVDLRVVAGGEVAHLEQRDHVIKQAADIGMVQRLG